MMKVLFTLFCLSLSACGEQSNAQVSGTTKDIQWGHHWSGPELKAPADLKGKVVLLKIWGG